MLKSKEQFIGYFENLS